MQGSIRNDLHFTDHCFYVKLQCHYWINLLFPCMHEYLFRGNNSSIQFSIARAVPVLMHKLNFLPLCKGPDRTKGNKSVPEASILKVSKMDSDSLQLIGRSTHHCSATALHSVKTEGSRQ